MWRVFFFLLSFAAFGQTEITFWHSMTGVKGKLLKELVSEFNVNHAGKINAKLQFVGTYEDCLNKVRTSMLAHKGPHVVQILDIGTQVMIDTGGIQPLQTFIDKDPEFHAEQILPEIKRYYEINHQLYSLPFSTSNPILYYNVGALQKAGFLRPPQTFEELRQYAKKLSEKSKNSYGITWPLHSWFFEEFLAVQGANLANFENGRVDRATEVNLLAEESIAFINLWKDLVLNGSFANVGRGWDPAVQNFLAERSAMLITSTSDVFEMHRNATFPLATAPLPKRNLKDVGGTILGGNSLWILNNKPQKEQDASFALVKFLSSKAVQKKWHVNTGYFPIRKDAIEELTAEGFYQKFPSAKTAIDQLRSAAPVSATAGALMGVFPECRENISSAIEKILTGTASVEGELKRAKELTERALLRYNRARQRVR